MAGGAYHEFVENVDWKRLWVFNPEEQPDFIFVIMGLDCWSSRVCAMSDIRRAAGVGSAKVLVIQAALERDKPKYPFSAIAGKTIVLFAGF